MSAADRAELTAFPPRTAALICLTTVFFSHLLPLALSAALQPFRGALRGNYLFLVISAYLPVILALWSIRTLVRRDALNDGFFLPSLRDVKHIASGWFIAFIGVGTIGFLWEKVLTRFHIDFARRQGLLEMSANCPGWVFWALFIFAAVLVPVWEEIAFRRALYSLFLPLGKVAACIAGAAVFSALHFFLLGFPGLFFLGIVLQIALGKTKNLTVPVVIHGIFNAVAMLATHFLPR